MSTDMILILVLAFALWIVELARESRARQHRVRAALRFWIENGDAYWTVTEVGK